MERIQLIWEHPVYQQEFQSLQTGEKDRIYCRHTLEHFLDVARLMWIEVLETGNGLSQTIVYAAAMLHDIGRFRELSEGTPHDEAGAALAGAIMKDCEFTASEIQQVQEAIGHHRAEGASDSLLGTLLYKADKQSRNCFCCPAEATCKWPVEKKNLVIRR